MLDSRYTMKEGLPNSLLDDFDPVNFAATLFERNILQPFLEMKVQQELISYAERLLRTVSVLFT